MTGVALHVESRGLEAALSATGRLAGWQLGQLAEMASELVSNQTKDRIASDKAAPDGAAWADWSEDYAATRHGGHSLLQGRNHLLTSIQPFATADAAIVGSNLAYAAVHQGGSEDGDTPARPYLGLSDENEKEVEALILRMAGQVVR